MATASEIAPYVDLRLTIDNNAPSYDYTQYQVSVKHTAIGIVHFDINCVILHTGLNIHYHELSMFKHLT